jgi:branched-chain amino acid transport system substrate-binding protein
MFLNLTTPKFAAMAMRKMGELGWKPVHILNNVSASVGAVIKPAGYENARDAISASYVKDPTDPLWKDDPAIKEWEAFLDKYVPDADKANSLLLYAYAAAQVMEQIVKQAGDNLTRENIMKQAENLIDLKIGAMVPGIVFNTGPTDHFPIEQMQLMRFKGEKWEMLGPVTEGKITD